MTLKIVWEPHHDRVISISVLHVFVLTLYLPYKVNNFFSQVGTFWFNVPTNSYGHIEMVS